MDNKAEKYTAYSPYNYAVNNPIKYIDPDGNEIVISTKNGDLSYKNGKLYQSNGKNYQGQDKFVAKTLAALNKLSSLKDETVKSVLNMLETSKQKISIESGYNGGITYPEKESDASEGKPTGSIVSIDYTQKGEDGKVVESEILIGHELSHAYDFLKGNNKDEKKSSADSKTEQRAVKFENRIRKEENKKERTTYGGKKIN